MIRKGQPLKFKRSGSISERVFKAIEQGATTKRQIVVDTSLPWQRVTTAVQALTFTANIVCIREDRITRYYVAGMEPISQNTADFNALMQSFYGAANNEK